MVWKVCQMTAISGDPVFVYSDGYMSYPHQSPIIAAKHISASMSLAKCQKV